MSKKYEDRFASFMDRLFIDDAEARKEEIALYIDVKVLDDADRFPGAYRGTALFEKMNEQDNPVEEVRSHGRHTTRAIRRKQTFHARNRAKEVCEIRKANERKRWDDLCRHPWKPIKKQTHKRDNKVRVEEENCSLPKFDYQEWVQKSYEDPDYKVESWEYADLFYENQQRWANVYTIEQRKRIAPNIRTLQIPPVTFFDIVLYGETPFIAKRKTKDVFVIETNYGYGWETESTYDTKEEAKRDLPDYVMMVKSYGGNARIRKVRRPK